MKLRWIAAPLAVGVVAAMLPGATVADQASGYYVEAGCLDGGRGPQFMDLSGTFPTLDAWRQLAMEVEAAAMPDTGEVDGACTSDSIIVFSIERVGPAPIEQGNERPDDVDGREVDAKSPVPRERRPSGTVSAGRRGPWGRDLFVPKAQAGLGRGLSS